MLKQLKMMSQLHLKNEVKYEVDYLHVLRHPWMLVQLFRQPHEHLGMMKILSILNTALCKTQLSFLYIWYNQP